MLSSLVYGNLILNFFDNLNKKNIIDNNLPRAKLAVIRKDYLDVIRRANSVIKKPFNPHNEMDKDYYQWFKSDLFINYPEFKLIIEELENMINIKYLDRYLAQSRKKISKSFNTKRDLKTQAETAILEGFITRGIFQSKVKDLKVVRGTFKKSIDELTLSIIKSLKENKIKTLNNIHTDTIVFRRRLYHKWQEPLDLLELLINSSMEIGGNIKKELAAGKKKISNPRYVALIKIHARAIQVANEILTLLKSGYADGANGRWRTLYELTAIFLILKNNPEFLSEKYLEHRMVKRFKEVQDFEDYYRRLGYTSFPKKHFQRIKNQYNQLRVKYGSDIKKDLGWIPSNILSDRNFKSLTKKVGIDHYLPFYNSSLDSVHAGALGFYRLGLPSRSQDEILFAGPSDYGLADPLQNTAYCLKLIDVTLLSLSQTYENAMYIVVLSKFFDEIGEIAANIQKKMDMKMKTILV